jgi:hypothetical protein
MIHVNKAVRCLSRIFAVALVSAGIVTATSAEKTSAPTCVSWPGVQPPNLGSSNWLRGVDVLSSHEAWAVGEFDPQNGAPTATLIAHWDGSAWQGTTGGGGILTDVAALSRTDAWAVGYRLSAGRYRAVILHWNGKVWQWLPSSVGPLYGVAAISSGNAWAVGSQANPDGHGSRSLVLHWNGTRWKRVASPNPGGLSNANAFYSVDAVSATRIWAVGEYTHGDVRKTLTARWNGSSWKHVASPNPVGTSGRNLNVLDGVAALSRTNVWAVGYDGAKSSDRNTLIEHWNGHAWKHVASPNPGASSGSVLADVAAVSPGNIWAVGSYGPSTAHKDLVVHWNGIAWMQVATPDLGDTPGPDLSGVTTTPGGEAWAVGRYFQGGPVLSLAIRCS